MIAISFKLIQYLETWYMCRNTLRACSFVFLESQNKMKFLESQNKMEFLESQNKMANGQKHRYYEHKE
jgi:hypothetical protein